MQLCSNAAELCEVQKLKGVTALSSKAVTAGLTEQHWCSWHEQVSQASVMCIFAEMQQRWVMQKLKGVTALSSKAVTAGLMEQHWCNWHQQVPKLQCCASLLKCSSSVRSAKTHRCDCTDKHRCLQLASKEQHWCSWHEQVSQASVMCIFAQMHQSCVNCKNSKV